MKTVERGSRHRQKERKSRKTAEEKDSGGGGRAREEGRGDDGDSENARAKGYEMKFSSHPFCVSEGIPVRQEVPSRNRRKRRSQLEGRERRRGRVTEGDEKEGRRASAEMAVEPGRTGLQDIGRGGFRDGKGMGRAGSKGTVSRAQIVSSFPKGRYTVHSKTF